ncbi:unnamed protein product [Polarella glacialis]|uniref:Uncharacterized protein n=1 Tax=Polarella glacialis TaxID=89957 RepID=A0A813JSZ0_POLGL|nr:unnamed protein product [Polarella glacialis]
MAPAADDSLERGEEKEEIQLEGRESEKGPLQEDDEGEDIAWADIRGLLEEDSDPRVHLFLESFEVAYSIGSPSAALSKVKVFLGSHLAQDLDYKGFCVSLGSISEEDAGHEELWKSHEAQSLDGDLAKASSVMLRLAVAVAKAYCLQMSDWEDINAACGNAVRTLPACYRLQRRLPGALNDARALRAATPKTSDPGQDLNPWSSEEGQLLFERHHDVAWADIEALTANDGLAKCCFAGVFAVEKVVQMDGLAIVHISALHVGKAPEDGSPAKKLAEGDLVLWEVDADLGKLLLPGLAVHGDWYELQNEMCFMSNMVRICPAWAV